MTSQQTQAEQNKALVRRWFAELNTGNLAAADDLYAANYVLHDPGAPPDLPPGPAGVKQFLAPFGTAFPDMQGTIEDMVAEGDKVVIRFTVLLPYRKHELITRYAQLHRAYKNAMDMVSCHDYHQTR